MKRKAFAMIMTSMMAMTMLAGCGDAKVSETPNDAETNTTTDNGEAEEVTLKVWTPENQRSNQTIEKMAESFQKEHPEWDIDFVFEIVGEDKAKDEVMKDVDSAADVFFFANDQMVELVNAGALAKLGGKAVEDMKANMSESVVGTVTNPDDNSIYGIPFTHNTFFMYYDKSIFGEEDVKTMEGIMNKETADDVTNFFFESGGGWKLGAWYYGAGNTIYGESQNDFAKGCDWNNETGVAVTNYLIDLKNNPKCAFDNEISITEKISQHQLGAWFDGPWNYESYKEILGDDLGLAVLPTFNLNGEDKQLKGFYGSKAIGVNSHSKALPAAIAFATYLGSEEMQIQRFKESNQIPTNNNAAAIEEVLNDEVASVMVKEAEMASVTQPLAAEFGSKYWANVGGIGAEIKSGALTKENAKEKLDVFVKTLEVE